MKKSAMLGRVTESGAVTTPIAQPTSCSGISNAAFRIEHDGCQHESQSDAWSDQKTCERHAYGFEEHGLHRRSLYHISSRAHSFLM
jgi:hypothetical protein